MATLTDPLLVQLAERLSSQDVFALDSLPGGASSLTYAGQRGNQRVVVKVSAAGSSPDREPRRVAASSHHPGAEPDTGTGSGTAFRRTPVIRPTCRLFS